MRGHDVWTSLSDTRSLPFTVQLLVGARAVRLIKGSTEIHLSSFAVARCRVVCCRETLPSTWDTSSGMGVGNVTVILSVMCVDEMLNGIFYAVHDLL